MDISDSEDSHKEHCIPCLEGKQHHVAILTESDVKSPRVLHRTYLDICGPMETMAWRGFRYFITFVDGYLHCLVVKLIKLKSDVPKLTKEYLERVEAETGKHVNYFCSDRGGEYGLTALQDYFKSRGIHHKMTNAYTPQENGVSKQMNCTLVKMARAMLSDTGLPNAYWGDAILYATHVLNHVPTRAIDEDLMPHEAFTGNKPSIAHLRIFRCRAHIHVPDKKWCKLDTKSVKCVFLGFAENWKAYICIHHPSGCIFESRDVVFDEGSTNAPSCVKIDNLYLNVEETKWSVAGTSPEAIEGNPDLPGEDGKTTSGDQAPGDVSVDGEPSEGVNDDGNALTHVPDQSDCTRSPPDVELRCQIANVEPANEWQVSRSQCNTRQLECTFDGHSSHLLGPLSPYPVPIPTPAVICSSCARKMPIHDDNPQFFVNAYERTPLEEEIQLNKYGIEDLPSRIESLDDGGERHALM